MKPVLLVDFGSTFTKITAVDSDAGDIIGTSAAYTTVAQGIDLALNNALENLYAKTGRIDFTERYACSSAAGGLKMIVSGLVPDLTAKAAKYAALGAGAKVIRVFSYELTEQDAAEIEALKPDIFLLSGGTDGGNKEVLLHNANVISGFRQSFPVVVAGNRTVGMQALCNIVESGKEAVLVDNVMPEYGALNIEPAREAIRNLFLGRIIQAKGLSSVQEVIRNIIMPTPKAVMDAAYLLSKGCDSEAGLGDLIVVDAGGATTDVHSASDGSPTASEVILKGLPEPYLKRTVEGDLGIRYNASSIVQAAGLDAIQNETGIASGDILEYLNLLDKSPDFIPKEESHKILDNTLAAMAVKIAVERHAGKLTTEYSPFGVTYIQSGKDLGKVKYVIGTGGPVINSKKPLEILNKSLCDSKDPFILKPREPEFLLDKKYILAAMGLLARKYPRTALRIMKRELVRLE